MIMRRLLPMVGLIAALPLAASVVLHAQEPAAPPVAVPATKFLNYFPQGKACVRYRDAELNLTHKLEGAVVEKLLTREAQAAGVEVWSTNSDENKFGNVSLLYFQPKGDCVLWYETISVVEYCARLGLTPYGVSPFYKENN
jgi:hypothetical protein